MRVYPAVRIEGGLFAPDLFDQLMAGALPGQRPADFRCDGKRSLTDEVASVFADVRSLWRVFQNRRERLPESDWGTSLTRDAWVIPLLNLLGYELRYNTRAPEVNGEPFPISHRAGEREDSPPVHIVSFRQDLGRVPPSGRPRLAPHSLVQEYLNRTDHLWGLVTNGLTLRLLRDSAYVRRQAYVEFDLAAIFDEQHFEDFFVLYRLLHRTRLPSGIGDAARCLLEQYYQHSVEQGGRVRDRLRDGVEECIRRLGNAFLAHPGNEELRRRLNLPERDPHAVNAQKLYAQLLRLVYRFLFLLVSEDRGLISPNPVYREHYGVARLRRLVDNRSAYNEYDDIWYSLRVLWRVLAHEKYARLLDVAPLDGALFDPITLDTCTITNRDLLEAFWYLTYYQEDRSSPPRRINYSALGTEELGSVYESLLEFHPQIDRSGPRPRFELGVGRERKSTGSYYTPPQLVNELIRSALEPVIQERLKGATTREAKERALLSIKVCDPAAGSGHFLLAAARRLGKELARIRSEADEPPPDQVREATRDVVAHCIYGVDKNPLAVELCRVALWLEAHCEGKPLTFLDHRIRCGDSLVGVFDLSVLRQGIPDEAFTPRTGDDRAVASDWKKRNRKERSGQRYLPFDPVSALPQLAAATDELSAMRDDTPDQVRRKRERYERQRNEVGFLRQLEACNLWTAAFFQPLRKGQPIITTETVLTHLEGREVTGDLLGLAEELAQRHWFFHWPLEFPEVFAQGGFDVVLSNPPWERIKLQEEEFFAARDRDIAGAPTAAERKKLIARLREDRPQLWREYTEALDSAEATSNFLRNSSRFPLTGRGDINTYAVFAELCRALLRPAGRAGIIVPTGIATDHTTSEFFDDLAAKRSLVSLYDFENRKGIFPGVHRSYKFCLLTLGGAGRGPRSAEYAFFCHEAADLSDPERRFTLSAADFRLLNPNTRTAPIFRSRRDAELTKHIYRRVPVLIEEAKAAAGNPWQVQFLAMLHMANDSYLFRTRGQLEGDGFRLEGNVFVRGAERWLPLYEAKMVHQFDHRFGDYSMQPAGSKDTQLPEVPLDRLADPDYLVLPRYWVPETEVESRLKAKGWDRGWLLGWRDITNATNERTVIAAVIPRVGVGDTFLLALPGAYGQIQALLSVLNSFALDFAARQKVGGTHLKYHVFKQLPVPPPNTFLSPCPWSRAETLADWIRPRVLELTYTAWDLEAFARDLGYHGPPFRFDPERRARLRAELDACFFHLYLGTPEEWEREATPELRALFPTPRAAVEYILEQFPIVRRRDEERFGEYRTKRVILEIYDQMLEAMRSGRQAGELSASG
jgi:hypothetical protein